MVVATLALPAVGFVIGLVVTLSGGGGGVFYVPVLLALGVPYTVAVPTSIATIIPTTLFGSIGHFRAGNVAWRIGSVVIGGTVIGTYCGTFLTGQVTNGTLERIFGGFLLAIAAIALLRTDDDETTQWTAGRTRQLVAIGVGIVAGVATAVFGISGTPILLPGLYLLGLGPRTVVGTSVFVILGNAIGGVFWYAELQGIDWQLVTLFGAGAAAGAVVAPEFYRYLPTNLAAGQYERIFIAILILTGAGFVLGVV